MYIYLCNLTANTIIDRNFLTMYKDVTHKSGGSIHPPSFRKRKVHRLFSPIDKNMRQSWLQHRNLLGKMDMFEDVNMEGKISAFRKNNRIPRWVILPIISLFFAARSIPSIVHIPTKNLLKTCRCKFQHTVLWDYPRYAVSH